MREILYKTKWRRYHPTAFAKFAELQANESRTSDELMARQEIARQTIVHTAMTQTSFYSKHYASVGFEVGDIGKEGWFEHLPIVTKKDLRERFDEFINARLRPYMRITSTGGSTGIPTKVGYDARVPEEVYSWRLQRWFGVNSWDDHAYVWRDTRTSKFAQLKNALLWWPTKHLKLNAGFITNEKIESFLYAYKRLRPTLLLGYVGALAQIAQYVLEHDLDVLNEKLKCVWTTSAPLANVQRKLLERAFGAKVCDQYGSCEVRWIAQQCAECGGLHVNMEHVHVEFSDAVGELVRPGEYGNILLTDLENTAFPLIRYANGDCGRWRSGSCACGRSLPCIDPVKGREVESFVLPSGKTITGEFLTTIFDEIPEAVRGFRVIQHKNAAITIEYIPSLNVRRDDKRIINVLSSFNEKLGNEVPVEFKQVNHIPHDRGKLRFVVKE